MRRAPKITNAQSFLFLKGLRHGEMFDYITLAFTNWAIVEAFRPLEMERGTIIFWSAQTSLH